MACQDGGPDHGVVRRVEMANIQQTNVQMPLEEYSHNSRGLDGIANKVPVQVVGDNFGHL